MTNQLFTPPERRPAPGQLRERILDEIEAEPVQEHPARRWLAPLVACGVAAAGVGGVFLVRHQAADVPSRPPSTTASTAPLPLDQAKKLVEACTALAKQNAGLTGSPVMSPSRHTVLVPYRTGDKATGAGSGPGSYALCSGNGSVGNMDIHDPGPDTVDVFTTDLAGQKVISVGGPAPRGASQALLASDEPVTVAHGFWVADRLVAAGAMPDQPDGMGVTFAGPRGQEGGTWVFAWPGGGRTPAPAGDTLAQVCPALQTPPSDIVHSVIGSGAHAALVFLRRGEVQACTAESVTSGGADAHGIVSQGTIAQWAVGVNVLGGKLPAGVTGVRVRTPQGVQVAVVKDGYWVVEDLVPPSQEMLEPEHLFVEMTGSRPQSFWIDWKSVAPVWRGNYATKLRGFDTGAALDTACRAPSSALRSEGGHVVWVPARSGSQTPTVCTSGRGFAYNRPVSVTKGFDAASFAVDAVHADSGAGLVYGGGLVPAGVTSVTFVTPTGPIPATVQGGRWVFEQVMASYDKAQRPTAVRLAGPGVDRTITLS